VKLTTRLHLVPGSMRGAIHPLPQYTYMEWCSVKKSTEKTLPLPFTYKLYSYIIHSDLDTESPICLSESSTQPVN
jgi:hypothetical protein